MQHISTDTTSFGSMAVFQIILLPNLAISVYKDKGYIDVEIMQLLLKHTIRWETGYSIFGKSKCLIIKSQ